MNKKIWMMLLLVGYELPLISVGQPTEDHSITIFVHGTYLMRKLFQYSHYRPLMYCPQGLSLAKDLPDYYHFNKMAKGCMHCDCKSYNMDQFYVFGWKSEHVNDYTRNNSARDLVDQLYKVVTDYYTEHQVIPKVRLLGYSHGGNVVLNMANHLPYYPDIEMEVWLFGTPVQQVNHNQVYTHCFKKIYSVYSKKDWIQVVDPQGIKNKNANFWSGRTFEENAPCIQVEILVNGKGIAHDYYNQLFQLFPKIKQAVDSQAGDMENGMITVDFKK
ncbi:hypothetical protein [Candidatus Chromulinivorax destructor]|uniref:Uncharacterized protein n=1 Tax=Candidatus Chromulinivorax destructor TaxID=2066483 RepID=A0A345ZB59_9BACT|nr:hypothetical protein [Candidatus Chromulinivorax destructor]AXK60526.1 hypothetical protein C0J27_02085 [Candidatus Chromulinivorax destructor]